MYILFYKQEHHMQVPLLGCLQMSKFFAQDINDSADDAKAIAVPRVFSENSRANKSTTFWYQGLAEFQ